MMLDVRDDLVLIDSSLQPAGTCAVCGKPVGEGEVIRALYGRRIPRFRCSGCLALFRRDPSSTSWRPPTDGREGERRFPPPESGAG
jgi:hypothetical protein